MSSSQHTPGKLKAVEISLAPGICNVQIENEKNELVAMFKGINKGREDSLRMVACWNACEGINPEAVPALLQVVKESLEFIGDYSHALEQKARAALALAQPPSHE